MKNEINSFHLLLMNILVLTNLGKFEIKCFNFIFLAVLGAS